MNLLDQEREIRAKIFEYFGYVEDWRILPFDDARGFIWSVDQDEHGCGTVHFADTVEQLRGGHGNCYSNEIYTQRHLPKWIYRGEEFTMIVVDTNTDSNQFLQIFANKNERPGVWH